MVVASMFLETPRRLWISSFVKPLLSRNSILRPVDESRISSFCKNLEAWSTKVALVEVGLCVALGTLSLLSP